MRTLCYTTKLVSAIQAAQGNDEVSKKFAIFSSKMSQTRANLRLLDDLPMVQYTMDYGWGDKEPDHVMAAIGLVTNVFDHLYYPVDKICWLIEQKIINLKHSDRWDTINSILWATSIYLNLMKWVDLVSETKTNHLVIFIIFRSNGERAIIDFGFLSVSRWLLICWIFNDVDF